MTTLKGIAQHPFWVDSQLTDIIIGWIRKDRAEYDYWKHFANFHGDSPRVAAALQDHYSAKLEGLAQDDIQIARKLVYVL